MKWRSTNRPRRKRQQQSSTSNQRPFPRRRPNRASTQLLVCMSTTSLPAWTASSASMRSGAAARPWMLGGTCKKVLSLPERLAAPRMNDSCHYGKPDQRRGDTDDCTIYTKTGFAFPVLLSFPSNSRCVIDEPACPPSFYVSLEAGFDPSSPKGTKVVSPCLKVRIPSLTILS